MVNPVRGPKNFFKKPIFGHHKKDLRAASKYTQRRKCSNLNSAVPPPARKRNKNAAVKNVAAGKPQGFQLRQEPASSALNLTRHKERPGQRLLPARADSEEDGWQLTWAAPGQRACFGSSSNPGTRPRRPGAWSSASRTPHRAQTPADRCHSGRMPPRVTAGRCRPRHARSAPRPRVVDGEQDHAVQQEGQLSFCKHRKRQWPGQEQRSLLSLGGQGLRQEAEAVQR